MLFRRQLIRKDINDDWKELIFIKNPFLTRESKYYIHRIFF